MIQPVVAGTLGAVGGAIPGFQVFTTIMVNSLLSGSANAFLTLRVGIIAKDYCGSLVAEPRTQVRRAATAEAARLLSGIVKESGTRVRDAIWKEIKTKIPRPWPLAQGPARDRLTAIRRLRPATDDGETPLGPDPWTRLAPDACCSGCSASRTWTRTPRCAAIPR